MKPKKSKKAKDRAIVTFADLVTVTRTSFSLLTREETLRFFWTVFLRMAMNGLDLVAVGLTGLLGAITAAGISGGSGFYILGFRIPDPTANNVITLITLIALMVVVKGGLSIWLARYSAIVLATIEIKNSLKIARYLFSGPLARLRHYSRTEIQWTINTSTNAAISGILGGVTTIIIDGTLFLSILVVFLIVDPWAAIAVMAYFGLLVFILQRTTARRYLQAGENIRTAAVDAGRSILEMVDGFREISVLSKQDFFLTEFGEAKKLDTRTGLTLQILKRIPPYVAETGLIIGVLAFVVWQLSSGTLADGLIAVGIFMAGSFRMMGAVLPLQQLWNDLRVRQNWVVMAQEILIKLKDEPELLDPRPYSKSLPIHSGLAPRERFSKGLEVEFSDVFFTHLGNSEPTIHGVNLEVAGGSYAAIVGPSGAGKTTIVDLLLGLHDPDSGQLLVGGVDPRLLREQSPGYLSYVPQKPGIISGSFASNIALGVPPELIDEGRVKESLLKAELLDFVEGLPDGIHSSLGSHADSLSGGQSQRLGLARALYSQPQLIILDEATSSLDASTEASISGSIEALGEETTVIVIAHRLSTIQHADRVYVVDNGRILASGTFAEVRAKVPMIEEYVRLMSFD